MKKKSSKILIGIIVILFLSFLGWRIFILVTKESDNNFSSGKEQAVAILAETIKLETIQDIKEFTGTIYPVYQYIIAPKISGRLEKISKRIGDFVAENEIIAIIDDSEYQQELLEAKANLTIAQVNLSEANSQLEFADIELSRVKSLKEKEFASLSDLENANVAFISAKSKVNLSNAQVEQRKAALKLAEIRLSYTVLKSSKPGFIGERFSDEGSLLTSNSPIVSVVGINTVIIRSNLIERIYGKIKIGQQADIEADAFPDKIFYGKVSRVAPILKENSRMAEMEIEVDNQSLTLKPGMFCKIHIVLNEKENAQVVPNKAIVMGDGKTGIFIVDENESIAKYIPVQLGITTENKSEIVEPVIDGLVITVGQYQLKDGSKILLPSDEEK
ncbi:MAG: efflux RND transporter periplasmic adaptor subunit [Armatimonadetes bacterium]|nr:efflux RND transporter periplasmic adaptor subunit [Armatimonadota bacterium]